MANSGTVKTLAGRVWSKFMDRVGSKVVSGMADTSSDAPNAHFKPKRDLYRHMEEAEHAHDHGHDHDHKH